MATIFIAGNYYKDSSREVVYLITSRTKCFVTYKEFWISDLINRKSCQDGKIKVRFTEDGSEYVLINGFKEIKSSNEYVVATEECEEITFNEVKTPLETYVNDVVSDELDSSGLEDKEVKKEIKSCHFSSMTEAYKYVRSFGAKLTGSISSNERSQYEYSINGRAVLICKEHGEPDYWVHVKEEVKVKNQKPATEECEEDKEVTFKLTEDNKEVIKAIVKLDPARSSWSNLARIAYGKLIDFVECPYDNCKDVYESALLVLSTLSVEDKARVKTLIKDANAHGNKFNCDGSLFVVTVSNCDCLKSYEVKFLGMDENKLCFELEDGDREYLARAIDLNYLKAHQSIVQNPDYTDLKKWERFNTLLGRVLSKV